MIALAVLAVGLAQAQAPAPSAAGAVVKTAVAAANAGHKVVLVEFGASWCTWCRHFEAFVEAPELKQIIAANYVVTRLTVHENDDKKALENPGGDAMMTTLGGERSGLPFYVFLDATGKKIADSNAMPDGGNIGFPGNAREVTAFLALIDKTAPHLTASGRAAIVAYLKRTVPA
jgi:thiol:disulfide interchange protein